MNILFKQEKDEETKTLNKLSIDYNWFRLCDKDVINLLNQICNERPDLFNELGHIHRLTRECQNSEAYIEELQDEIENLKEELNEFEDED